MKTPHTSSPPFSQGCRRYGRRRRVPARLHHRRRRRKGANERIGVGFIGTGGRGRVAYRHRRRSLKEQGRCEPVAVCDVYGPRLEAAAQKTGGKMYLDHQEAAGRPERRRGLHRHARPPSRPAGDRRLRRRQGRLLREAADALDPVRAGQAGRRGGREAQAARAGRHAVHGRRQLCRGPQDDRRRGSSASRCTCRRAISAAATGASGCRFPTPTPSRART